MAWLFPCLLMAGWQNHPFIPSDDPVVRRATMLLIGECMSGPSEGASCGCRHRFDADEDGDVDLKDYARLIVEMSNE